VKLKDTDKLEFVDRTLTVNGKPFVVQFPDEPLFGIADGRLITILFKGCGYTQYSWDPEEIEGYFPDSEPSS